MYIGHATHGSKMTNIYSRFIHCLFFNWRVNEWDMQRCTITVKCTFVL